MHTGSMRTRTLLGALAACLLVAAPAQAAPTFTFAADYTTPAVNSPTGLHMVAGWAEDGVPRSKPSQPTRQLVFTRPFGNSFDTTVAPQCTATADEIVASAGSACPPGSKIGEGSAEFITGFGPGVDPVPERVDVYNAPAGQMLHFTPTGSVGQTFVASGTFRPDGVWIDFPALCLPGGTPPDCANGEAAITVLDLTIPQLVAPDGRSYVRTPEGCDSAGWLMAGATKLKDGSMLFATSRTPCTLPTTPPPPPLPGTLKPGACANEKAGTAVADALPGTSAGDRLRGLAGDDVLTGLAGDDCLHGGAGDDQLSGGAGADLLEGERGDDVLDGGIGNDKLAGGAGADALSGGSGNDVLVGGASRDSFAAGAGNDNVDSRDRRRETVNCGRGRDRVRADRVDRLVGCERVSRR